MRKGLATVVARGAAAVMALVGGVLPALAADTPRRPNVLFIAVDDLRPELGCYGNPVVKTPNLDRLAQRGVVFTRAYCPQAVCSPSRAAILTGRGPDATKVWDLETHFRVALPDVVTLPQYFKENGYHCAALSKIYHHGFEDGRSWSEPQWYPYGATIDTDPNDWSKRITRRVGPGVREYAQQPADNDKNAKGPAFEVSPKSDEQLPDGFTAVEACKRLHELKDKPFFLAVGFLKPHLPFVAPKAYWDMYDPATIPGPAFDHLPVGSPEFAGHNNHELHSYGNIPAGNPIPADLARTLRHGYYAAISYTDAQIGRVLDALEKEGLADNTVVVVWGDHGWQLGEHGLWMKHTNFEVAARSPLLISVPGRKSAGKQCAATVGLIDIYPTLAEVCGLPVPAGVDGTSLKASIDDPSLPSKKVAMSQYPRGGVQTGNRPLMGYSIRDDRWRLTVWRDRRDGTVVATELYDEENDPAETKNLAASEAAVVQRLSAHLPAMPAYEPPAPKPAATNAPAAKPAQDRESMFAQKDTNADGKLTREEFLAHHPDPDAAPKRFELWDVDKDGFLSRVEFVRMGK